MICTISTDVNKTFLEKSGATFSYWVFEEPKVRWKPVIATTLLPTCSNRETDKLNVVSICYLLDLLPDISSPYQLLHQQVMIICFCIWWLYPPPVPDHPWQILCQACRACFGSVIGVAHETLANPFSELLQPVDHTVGYAFWSLLPELVGNTQEYVCKSHSQLASAGRSGVSCLPQFPHGVDISS